jgi:hypothetical protein
MQHWHCFSFIADTKLFLLRITLPRSHCTEAEIILYFIVGIKVMKHEADHAPPSTSEIKNLWLFISPPLHIFGMWFLCIEMILPFLSLFAFHIRTLWCSLS